MNKSKENEASAMRRCKELKAETNVVRAKIASAISLTKEQIKDAEDKKNEIESTWKQGEVVTDAIKDLEDKILKTTDKLKEVVFESSYQDPDENK
mgnify:CR=1 FL=1